MTDSVEAEEVAVFQLNVGDAHYELTVRIGDDREERLRAAHYSLRVLTTHKAERA